MIGFYLHVYLCELICTRCMQGLTRPEEGSNLLGQESQVTKSCCVGAGWSRVQDPYNSSSGFHWALSSHKLFLLEADFPTVGNISGHTCSLESPSPELFLGAICTISSALGSTPQNWAGWQRFIRRRGHASGNSLGECLGPEHQFHICRRRRGR